ncbi:MAG: LEA type 2 family protein [Flavobacteriales bacterium]|nr:LEA type 2 family protein [Flavobacteriales bacterium]MDG1781424.1 LEA type 2 family protein [Flavobacteriales bacterium]MDG2245450.1 LEA type 2 family protein [Flavobacteriales bacterium]
MIVRMTSISNALAKACALMMIISLSSCSFYKEIEVLAVDDIAITEFNKDVVEVDLTVTVDNPNWYAVTLTQSEIDVFVNSKNMGAVQLVEKVKLPSKSKSTKVVKLRGDAEDLSGNFLDNLLSLLFAKNAEFQAKGTVTGRALLISRKIPVDITETVDIKGLMEN